MRERGIDKIKRLLSPLLDKLKRKKEINISEETEDNSGRFAHKKILGGIIFFVASFLLGIMLVTDFGLHPVMFSGLFSSKKEISAESLKKKPPFLDNNKTAKPVSLDQAVKNKKDAEKKVDNKQTKSEQAKIPASVDKSKPKVADKLPDKAVKQPVNDMTSAVKPVDNTKPVVQSEQPVDAKPKIMAYAGIPAESPFVPEVVLETLLPSPSLPAIPTGMNIPNVSHVPVPPPGMVPGAAPAPQKENVKITGISISNSGSSAIMSNGAVLSKGDTFNDNRIAWIGGDGIHFEDGSTIEYH